MNYSLTDWMQLDLLPEAKLLGIEVVRLAHALGSRELLVEDIAVNVHMAQTEVHQHVHYRLKPLEVCELTDDQTRVRVFDGMPWLKMLDRPGADWARLRQHLLREQEEELETPDYGLPRGPAPSDPPPESKYDVAKSKEVAELLPAADSKPKPKKLPEEPPRQEPGQVVEEHVERKAEAGGGKRVRFVAKELGVSTTRFLEWYGERFGGTPAEVRGLTGNHKLPNVEDVVAAWNEDKEVNHGA